MRSGTVPQSTRVAVLANPAFEVYPLYLHNLTVAARALGLPCRSWRCAVRRSWTPPSRR